MVCLDVDICTSGTSLPHSPTHVQCSAVVVGVD